VIVASDQACCSVPVSVLERVFVETADAGVTDVLLLTAESELVVSMTLTSTTVVVIPVAESVLAMVPYCAS
jgi:hypothetical protein